MGSSPDVTGLNVHSMVPARRINPLRTAPNLLTLLRICLSPFLIVAVMERRFHIAFALFIVAACTDAMDGLLARWLQQRTMLGQYLDPVADKLLLSSLFLVLTHMGILEARVTVMVFGRDLGMLLVAGILYSIAGLRDFHPTILGKINSFSQVVAIGVVLLYLIYPQAWVAVARAAALDTTILLTVASGFHYAWVASKRIGTVTGHGAEVGSGGSVVSIQQRRP
ncbi:CDP-alcohol phosphatidyltransferase family protein [Acidicapsa ligni]|uniref:CDP-alcohol phosphatidyltransferase family protein n=1 Tax=Acidicapsa ligni TaxID=542300 RepID=UPI0021E09108|nr:CDP-alcohol phosphatidyltransferase family protein [Acidicapsa ligni]